MVPSVPWVGARVILKVSPALSMSLASRVTVLATPWWASSRVLSTATGASLTAFTVTVTWPVSVRVPSLTV